MSKKSFLRALFAVLTGLLALGAALVPAQAAGSPSWHIARVFGQYPLLEGDTATGPDDAWAVGAGFGSSSLAIEQWAGTGWHRLAPPRGFADLASKTVNDGVVDDSSASDLWTFPQVSGAKSTSDYALHWNGSTWATYKLPAGQDAPFQAVDFGPGNLWVFSQVVGSGPGLGWGPPWVSRFNGSTWQRVSMPGTPLDVSVLSADDMWTFGPNLKTAGQAIQHYIGMHWNGTSWQTVKLPVLAKVKGHPWIPDGIFAVSDTDVWLSELVAGDPGTGAGPPGITLLHWNGTAWSTVSENTSLHFYGGLTPDGSGGFWLSGTSATTAYIVHYANGQWSKQLAPAKSGYTDNAGTFQQIPGTTSVWALGTLTSTAGNVENAILKYGN